MISHDYPKVFYSANLGKWYRVADRQGESLLLERDGWKLISEYVPSPYPKKLCNTVTLETREVSSLSDDAMITGHWLDVGPVPTLSKFYPSCRYGRITPESEWLWVTVHDEAEDKLFAGWIKGSEYFEKHYPRETDVPAPPELIGGELQDLVATLQASKAKKGEK